MDSVIHFDIPAEDLARAKEFYEKIFSWKINYYSDEYSLCTTTEMDEKTKMPKEVGSINGGLQKKDDMSPYPIVVIGVKDIDLTIKNILARGGKIIMGKKQMGDMGTYAKLTDSENNVIGIWQNAK